MSKSQTICLNMIVKNESHVIIQTLENILSNININYWVISDTGSTDNTKELIQTYFNEKKIPGELLEHAWVDFGFNRTIALECAFNKSDYLFFFDADDTIEGKLILPDKLTYDKYDFIFGHGFTYLRPLLINNRKKWKYIGVLHEYLVGDDIKSIITLQGDYYIVSGKSGDRNKDPNKYIKDAIILKNAFEKEEKMDLNLASRYAFYCAQSYRDAGPTYTEETLDWYKKCLILNNWDQEKFFACIMIGNIYDKKNDMNNAYKYWLKSIEYDRERLDGIILASTKLLSTENYLLVNLLYNKYKNYNKHLQQKLFLFDYLYQGQFEYHNSIAAYYCNDLVSGYNCSKLLLSEKKLEYANLICVIKNLIFYKECMKQDKNSLDLFYNLNYYFPEIHNFNNQIDASILEVWKYLYTLNLNKLCKFNKYTFKNNNINPKILITFTTCKRFKLFTQTINSLLTHWNDYNKIDYWFCVDDNSMEEERINMKKLYSWIDFYMKTPEEKGHLKSMNIIWNKIKELKPQYWIHMEDDFVFFDKMNYIDTSIRGLTELKKYNVKQILFNKNYSETIDNYSIKGQMTISKEFALHQFIPTKEIFTYTNCHYWPHYSFRPSFIEVEAILKIGNFDCDVTFFEEAYAHKWINAGYKSGFFNKITNVHIGRLTSERHDLTKQNAYRLNNESQFYNNEIEEWKEHKIEERKEDKIEERKENIQLVIEDKQEQEQKQKPLVNNNIKIINLEKRIDRKLNMIHQLEKNNIINYEFMNAVDGSTIIPTLEMKELFKDNDFGYRRGVIGCALSHLNIWKDLVNDKSNDYYIIMEDDCTLMDGFKEKIEEITTSTVINNKDMILLGYSMYNEVRNNLKDTYNNTTIKHLNIVPLNTNIYIGGFFCYVISKSGAMKLLQFINNNGIKHGIDYLIKIIPNFLINVFEVQPQIAFSNWHETPNIDTNIQNDFNVFDFSTISMKEIMNYYKVERYFNEYSIIYEKYLSEFKELNINIFDFNLFINSDLEKKEYTIGNNLFAWREYFKNAMIYSLTNTKEDLVNTNNIKTFLANTQNNNYLFNLFKEIQNIKFDFIIDSNKNGFDSTIHNFIIAEKHLSFGGLYILENIVKSDMTKLVNFSCFNENYKSYLLDTYDFYYNYNSNNTNLNMCIFILKDNEKNNPFIFLEGVDIGGNDLYILHNKSLKMNKKISILDKQSDGFNTLGFFKKNLDIKKIHKSPYFTEKDGIYIKKTVYERYEKKIEVVNLLDNIVKNQNSINKKYCFIHSCFKEEIGTFILDNLVNHIIFSELYSQLDSIFIINIGNKLNENYFSNTKIKIINLNSQLYLAENTTINIMHSFSKNNPDSSILYLHTKGILHYRYITKFSNIKDWINCMLHFMVKNCNFCFEVLNNYDCIGCNYVPKSVSNESCPHYSGNFWWANTNYINKLQSISEIYYEDSFFSLRHEAEFWLLNNTNVKYYCIFNSNIDHYQCCYPKENYIKYNYNALNEIYKYKNKRIYRVKLIGNWDTSENICKEWSDMCEKDFQWKNIEITWENTFIDYYVIINMPLRNEYYNPSKTIVFQMEPWVKDEKCNWGVKTWGDWAIPDETKFLSVNGRKTNTHNNAFWQLGLKLPQLLEFKYEKINRISSICSSKYFDPGHILRINFLKFIEVKNEIEVDIYNKDNSLQWKNYKHPVSLYIDKYKGIVNYKYYFMMENNFEENFITEKIWEPILCETLVFYYGCPNVSTYINPLAYVELDINDFEKSYRLMKQALEEDWWSQRIDIIRQEKQKILNELAFFPKIQKIIQENENKYKII
jgi:GR25 family glycosyltransferase involved in LPS biosynthesis